MPSCRRMVDLGHAHTDSADRGMSTRWQSLRRASWAGLAKVPKWRRLGPQCGWVPPAVLQSLCIIDVHARMPTVAPIHPLHSARARIAQAILWIHHSRASRACRRRRTCGTVIGGGGRVPKRDRRTRLQPDCRPSTSSPRTTVHEERRRTIERPRVCISGHCGHCH